MFSQKAFPRYFLLALLTVTLVFLFPPPTKAGNTTWSPFSGKPLVISFPSFGNSSTTVTSTTTNTQPTQTDTTPTPSPTQNSSPTPTKTTTTQPTTQPKQTTPTTTSSSLSSWEDALVTLTNKARTDAGLKSLTVDNRVVAVARARSTDMATKNYFSHTSPTGDTAFTLLKAAGISYHTAGENIADNDYPSSKTVSVAFNDWMNSPGHKANILNSAYTAIGIGAATTTAGLNYFTQIFIGN